MKNEKEWVAYFEYERRSLAAIGFTGADLVIFDDLIRKAKNRSG